MHLQRSPSTSTIYPAAANLAISGEADNGVKNTDTINDNDNNNDDNNNAHVKVEKPTFKLFV